MATINKICSLFNKFDFWYSVIYYIYRICISFVIIISFDDSIYALKFIAIVATLDTWLWSRNIIFQTCNGTLNVSSNFNTNICVSYERRFSLWLYLLRIERGLQRDADGIGEVSDTDDDKGEPLPFGELGNRHSRGALSFPLHSKINKLFYNNV